MDIGNRFANRVSSIDELVALVGSPSELVVKKELRALEPHSIAFLERCPFVVLGTYGRDGRADVSPRGDWPAVAKVLDATRLVIPDRPGNRRVDTLRNVLETGRLGALFLTPGIGETLRINGRACLTREASILESFAVGGKTPQLAIGVEIEECYFQCAKALIRSKLWTRAEESHDFDLAQVLVDQICPADQTAESLRERINASYRDRLY